MDQDKDTIKPAKHVRGGRHWLADDAPATPNSEVAQSSVDQPPVEEPPVDQPPAKQPEPPPELPPTLFELPDRTPEALQKRKETPHFMLDEAHSGPPASHVDRPPGDFSEIDPPPAPEPSPFGPAAPLVQRPPSIRGSSDGRSVRIDSHPDAIPDPEHRIAAIRDDSAAEDYQTKPAWGVRTAITLLVLAMVTLAYFSGRSSRPGEAEKDLERVAATSNDEVLVDIAADFDSPADVDSPDVDSPDELSSDAEAVDSVSDPLRADDLGTDNILMEIANLPISESGASQAEHSETETSAAVPSYVAEASIEPENSNFASDTALGEPALAEKSAMFEAGLYERENIGLPDPLENRDASVAYRADSTAEETPEPADDLPAGMDDRLRLEDGLRYTGTPYPIGNFLEILRNWEASDQQ